MQFIRYSGQFAYSDSPLFRQCNEMISQTALQIRSLVYAVAMMVALTACGSQPATPYSSKATRQSKAPAPERTVVRSGDRAAAIALQQVGVPYRYGGSSPSGFDCSGLVHYSYARAGHSVPRTTQSLWHSVTPVSTSQMRAGDLLFFRIEGKMSHVGMYIGGGEFVHAPSSGKVVSVASLRADFYRDALIRAGRPIN